LPTEPIALLLNRLMEHVRILDPATHWERIDLVLLDDAAITAVNQRIFGRDGPTDVICQAYLAAPYEAGPSAEIFVNVQQAMRERERSGSFTRELALYIAHGCHHLSGAEDDTPAKRADMIEQELSWVGACEREGLLDGIKGDIG